MRASSSHEKSLRLELTVREQKADAHRIWTELRKAETTIASLKDEVKRLQVEARHREAAHESTIRLLEIATKEKRRASIALKNERDHKRRTEAKKTPSGLEQKLAEAQAENRHLARALAQALHQLDAPPPQTLFDLAAADCGPH